MNLSFPSIPLLKLEGRFLLAFTMSIGHAGNYNPQYVAMEHGRYISATSYYHYFADKCSASRFSNFAHLVPFGTYLLMISVLPSIDSLNPSYTLIRPSPDIRPRIRVHMEAAQAAKLLPVHPHSLFISS
jgi:hypothetical protein